jgi:hypothetical protein
MISLRVGCVDHIVTFDRRVNQQSLQRIARRINSVFLI